jgi:hypothetical protein
MTVAKASMTVAKASRAGSDKSRQKRAATKGAYIFRRIICMKKLLFLACLVLVNAAFAAAQTDDYQRREVFGATPITVS